MVRQKSRKTVEDLYTVAPPPPPSISTRFDENSFLNSKNNKTNMAHETAKHCSTKQCRKRSKTPNAVAEKDEKTYINEKKLFGKASKSKTTDPYVSSSIDNKNVYSLTGESEKDEDTEEFFALIKETVENAVGKVLSDILNRNFKEVAAKIDDLHEQLNVKLEKIQADVNNKIVHYGEENSRHFRYLCMKSEYDKMFYQHQNIMTTMPMDARPNFINPYPQQCAGHPMSKPPQQPVNPEQGQSKEHFCGGSDKSATLPTVSQCNCYNLGDRSGAEPSKSSTSTKSSDIGVKEVKELLDQLQKFYEHQQTLEKDDKRETRGNIDLNMQDESVDGEEDDEDSSDELSSPSIEEKLGAAGDY